MTGIPEQVLNKDIPLAAISVAYRFSWAAKRNNKRVEDMAYSLMGILQVNMPLLYGEGTKAFLRLQETVLSNSDDISALSWGFGLPWNEISSLGGGAVLAMSPAAFMHHPPEYAQNFRYKPRLHTTITGHGMHIDLAMVCVDTKNAIWLAIVDDNPAFRGAWLNKSYGIAVILRMVELGDTPTFERVMGCPPVPIRTMDFRRYIYQRGRSKMKTVYLRNSGTQVTMRSIRVTTASFRIQYLRRYLESKKLVKSASISWPLPNFRLPGQYNQSMAREMGCTRRDLLEQFVLRAQADRTGELVVNRAEFVIHLTRIYELEFELRDLYPPLSLGQLVETRFLIMPDGRKRSVPVLVCQGTVNQSFISIFSRPSPWDAKRPSRFGIKVDIIWDTISARSYEVKSAKWGRKRWVRKDAAIAVHPGLAKSPMFRHDSSEVRWDTRQNLSFQISSDQYYRYCHIYTRRTTGLPQVRKPGTCDCTIEVVDGYLHDSGEINGLTVHDRVSEEAMRRLQDMTPRWGASS